MRAEQAARNGGRGGLQDALALYERAEELDPTFAEAFAADGVTSAYIWRASFHDVLQSAPARNRTYEKASRALQLNPDLSSPYAILAIMQVVDRHYDEAIASAERADKLGAGDAETQIAVGYVQLFSGNHDAAAAAVEKALRLDPNLSAIDREVAGLVFLVQGNTKKAIETLERTRNDAPDVGSFRITLAAAYARDGRLSDAKTEIANGLRLQPTPRFASLAAVRLTWSAQFRNAQDAAALVEALKQAGMPEWPYGFTTDGRDRLNGEQIASLVLGHTLRGKLEPSLQPAILQVETDGQAAFRSTTRMITERVYVDQDLLCEVSENMFGRPDCGPAFGQRDSSDQMAYVYVNSSKIFYFSPIK